VQEVISAIDIGTTKICALTAEVTHDSLGNPALRVVGEGQAASRGIRRGVVVNVQEAANAIAEAVEKCERDMGQQVVSAYVGIAGSHIGTLNSKGVAPIDSRNGVLSTDMQRALEGARAVALPQNQEVIHAIARHWTVDSQTNVQQPLGMNAYRLEVDAHIVTGSGTAINNLIQCVTAHGIEVDELVLEPLASDRAVLRAEERHMGVAIVDMGGGTTDVAIFIDDGLCHTQILDLGGNHLSNDIAVGLHTPYETAEELKIRYGTVLPERVADDEQVWAAVFGEKSELSFSRRFICEVLEARAIEMFEIIQDKLAATGYSEKLPAGIVLTGGASQLPGMAELGREIFQMPVRIGAPAPHLPITGLSRKMLTPSYATGIGLLLWGLQGEDRLWRRHYTLEQGGQREWLDTTVRWLRNLLPD
jgi:cell division protein FtsA